MGPLGGGDPALRCTCKGLLQWRKWTEHHILVALRPSPTFAAVAARIASTTMNGYWMWMVKKKQSSVKRYGSDISWHEVPISRTLPIEPCPTGPPPGIICLKMWARKASMSSPSDKEGEQAVPSLSFRDSLSLSLLAGKKVGPGLTNACAVFQTSPVCDVAVLFSVLRCAGRRAKLAMKDRHTWSQLESISFILMEPAVGTAHMWRSYPPVETFFSGRVKQHFKKQFPMWVESAGLNA